MRVKGVKRTLPFSLEKRDTVRVYFMSPFLRFLCDKDKDTRSTKSREKTAQTDCEKRASCWPIDFAKKIA